jgi:hypothetical protein
VADTLNRDELVELAGWPAISIHLPVHPYGPDAAQDTIRFKNQLRAATEALAERMRAPQAESLLKPAYDLLDDPSFWREGFAGLAVFVSQAGWRIVRTPNAITESVSVSDRFSLRPLIAALGEDRPFYVLALTRKNSRLMKANREGLTEIDLGDTPVSVADTLAYDDIERGATFQYRTPTGAGNSRSGAVPAYHGHGAASKDKLANVTRFINQIEQGVSQHLIGDSMPLVLAGTESMVALYRQENTYPHLVDESIPGSADELSLTELHAAAIRIMQPVFAWDSTRDLERLQESGPADAATYNVQEIAAAAREGRVEVLFMTPDADSWGAWDAESARLEPHDSRLPGDWDLADFSAIETLLHGGAVRTVETLNGARDGVAAILRY